MNRTARSYFVRWRWWKLTIFIGFFFSHTYITDLILCPLINHRAQKVTKTREGFIQSQFFTKHSYKGRPLLQDNGIIVIYLVKKWIVKVYSINLRSCKGTYILYVYFQHWNFLHKNSYTRVIPFYSLLYSLVTWE